MLAQELFSLGINDILINNHATVTVVKCDNCLGAPHIDFIVHMDAVDVGLSPDIHLQQLHFTNGDLLDAGSAKSRNLALYRPRHIGIAFVPDENICLRGAKTLDLAWFTVNFVYTIYILAATLR